jgi:hypothetical protein
VLEFVESRVLLGIPCACSGLLCALFFFFLCPSEALGLPWNNLDLRLVCAFNISRAWRHFL